MRIGLYIHNMVRNRSNEWIPWTGWRQHFRTCMEALRGAVIHDRPALEQRAMRWRSAPFEDVCIAIRLGCFDQAQAMLDRLGGPRSRDAACLNLLGVVHEARRDWRTA